MARTGPHTRGWCDAREDTGRYTLPPRDVCCGCACALAHWARGSVTLTAVGVAHAGRRAAASDAGGPPVGVVRAVRGRSRLALGPRGAGPSGFRNLHIAVSRVYSYSTSVSVRTPSGHRGVPRLLPVPSASAPRCEDHRGPCVSPCAPPPATRERPHANAQCPLRSAYGYAPHSTNCPAFSPSAAEQAAECAAMVMRSCRRPRLPPLTQPPIPIQLPDSATRIRDALPKPPRPSIQPPSRPRACARSFRATTLIPPPSALSHGLVARSLGCVVSRAPRSRRRPPRRARARVRSCLARALSWP